MTNRFKVGEIFQNPDNYRVYYQIRAEATIWNQEDRIVQMVRVMEMREDLEGLITIGWSVSTPDEWGHVDTNAPIMYDEDEAYQTWLSQAFGA